MERQKKKCRKEEHGQGVPAPKSTSRSTKRAALLSLATIAVVALLSVAVMQKRFGGASTDPNRLPRTPATLAELLTLPTAQLEGKDIALMNLLCAQGLPGAENLDPASYLAILDQWALHAKSEIERNLYRFQANPADYENSEGYFRMLLMSVVVYEDFGVRYNPERMASPTAAPPADDRFFADSRDVLLHGLVGERRMGTCSSMPMLYVALGRRLGYPLKLVATKAHLFIRWDSPTDRFDLEATGKGMNRYDDNHFKSWPLPVTEEEISANGYLKSLSPAEELSVFLSIRAQCLLENGRVAEAVTNFEAACRFAPTWKSSQDLLADARQKLLNGWWPSLVSASQLPSVDAFIREAQTSRQAGPQNGPDPNPLLRMRSPSQ